MARTHCIHCAALSKDWTIIGAPPRLPCLLCIPRPSYSIPPSSTVFVGTPVPKPHQAPSLVARCGRCALRSAAPRQAPPTWPALVLDPHPHASYLLFVSYCPPPPIHPSPPLFRRSYAGLSGPAITHTPPLRPYYTSSAPNALSPLPPAFFAPTGARQGGCLLGLFSEPARGRRHLIPLPPALAPLAPAPQRLAPHSVSPSVSSPRRRGGARAPCTAPQQPPARVLFLLFKSEGGPPRGRTVPPVNPLPPPSSPIKTVRRAVPSHSARAHALSLRPVMIPPAPFPLVSILHRRRFL